MQIMKTIHFVRIPFFFIIQSSDDTLYIVGTPECRGNNDKNNNLLCLVANGFRELQLQFICVEVEGTVALALLVPVDTIPESVAVVDAMDVVHPVHTLHAGVEAGVDASVVLLAVPKTAELEPAKYAENIVH